MNTREVIRDFIKNTFFVEDFADDDSFLRSGVVDSTGIMELADFIETEFQFKMEDTELIPENVDSVENLVRFVERKRPKGTN